MLRNNTTFGKTFFISCHHYHIHISWEYHLRHIFITVPNPKTINPSWRSWNALRVTKYIQLQTLHPIAHSYSFTQTFHTSPNIATPSPSNFQLHSNTWFMSADTFTPSYLLFHPFMLNLLFTYPIYLINTNVGQISHPYYTNLEYIISIVFLRFIYQLNYYKK